METETGRRLARHGMCIPQPTHSTRGQAKTTTRAFPKATGDAQSTRSTLVARGLAESRSCPCLAESQEGFRGSRRCRDGQRRHRHRHHHRTSQHRARRVERCHARCRQEGDGSRGQCKAAAKHPAGDRRVRPGGSLVVAAWLPRCSRGRKRESLLPFPLERRRNAVRATSRVDRVRPK